MSNDKHLTPEEIAQCAEAINDGRYERLNVSLRNHLNSCEDCAGEVMIISEVSSELEGNSVLDPKPGNAYTGKKLYIGLVVAAAATILFFIVPLLERGKNAVNDSAYVHESGGLPVFVVDEARDTVYCRKHNKMEIAIKNNESSVIEEPGDKQEVAAQEEAKQKELLAEYQTNENLEQLYENLQGAYRSRAVKVNTPPTITYAEIDSLSWENPENEKLYVEFFDNKGEEVQTLVVEEEQVLIPDLSRGLYYWKLINEDFDLLFVGKIIVE
ncbi:MAG: hypothetical protein ACLFT6_07905 [Bacteroidales bacterium]